MNAGVRALADETSRGSVKRMFLLTFRDGDALKLGVRTDKGVVDVAAAQAGL